MKATDQTIKQVERTLSKIADKFPHVEEPTTLTDIHLRANQETGELVAFDDDDKEITRAVIEQWIGNTDESFYSDISIVIKRCINNSRDMIEKMAILKPFSFILENEEKELIEDLYLVDDDIMFFEPELMKGLDKDLDAFLDKLLKD